MFLLSGRPGKLLEGFSLHVESQMSLADSNLYIRSQGLRGPHNFLVWNFPRRFIKTWADSNGEKFLARSCERSDLHRGAGQGNRRNQGEWLEPMISLRCGPGSSQSSGCRTQSAVSQGVVAVTVTVVSWSRIWKMCVFWQSS